MRFLVQPHVRPNTQQPLKPIDPTSLPGLTRQSIRFAKDFSAKTMDARVKPAHDESRTTATGITFLSAVVPSLRKKCAERNASLRNCTRGDARTDRARPVYGLAAICCSSGLHCRC